MKAEGECPNCENKLGVRIANSIASLMGDTMQRFMDKDGNGMYCQECGEYVEPDDIEIAE